MSKANENLEADELAELLLWEKENEPKFKRIKALKDKLIADLSPATKPEAEVAVRGKFYEVVIEPMKTAVEIVDLKQVHKMLGDEMFYALVKLPITKAREYLTKPQLAKVSRVGRDGSRSISVKRVTRHAT